MIISLYGYENKLNVNKGEIALLNIRNKALYNRIQNILYYDFSEENNEIVFLSEDKRLLEDDIVYINDVITYEFDSKKILDSIVKDYVDDMNYDLQLKAQESVHYNNLIKPLLEKINILEIEYEYKDTLDYSFYSKFSKISFELNNTLDLIDKIINILKTGCKILRNNIFIFNRTICILTNDDYKVLNEYVMKNNIVVVFIDYLSDDEINIDNNLCINDDYGAYSIKITK